MQGVVNFTENGARYINDVAMLQYRQSGINNIPLYTLYQQYNYVLTT